jgi:hypothetical protein
MVVPLSPYSAKSPLLRTWTFLEVNVSEIRFGAYQLQPRIASHDGVLVRQAATSLYTVHHIVQFERLHRLKNTTESSH